MAGQILGVPVYAPHACICSSCNVRLSKALKGERSVPNTPTPQRIPQQTPKKPPANRKEPCSCTLCKHLRKILPKLDKEKRKIVLKALLMSGLPVSSILRELGIERNSARARAVYRLKKIRKKKRRQNLKAKERDKHAQTFWLEQAEYAKSNQKVKNQEGAKVSLMHVRYTFSQLYEQYQKAGGALRRTRFIEARPPEVRKVTMSPFIVCRVRDQLELMLRALHTWRQKQTFRSECQFCAKEYIPILDVNTALDHILCKQRTDMCYMGTCTSCGPHLLPACTPHENLGLARR
eukprot:TRINITY_DN17898_c0_g1_i1.p1 TRINITY_DN17898_c0_g1~~TRINITY_DN17898_c0_g1_i1.p1  ORF type:complete len:341 (+),score=11.15 TRINITY_DN17898_c0_g1_i1:148-1023(+)